MSKRIKPRLMKGTRDFLPRAMVRRDYVTDMIVSIFKRHGFLPLKTPAIEMWQTLSGKYGQEGEQLIYRFRDRGNRDLGLRYDLTVPLCRVVAMHQNEIVRPLKRYQIQPVWRADKPGKGRFREFYQCDIDVVGTKDLLADAEVIQVSYEILKELGFKNFRIKLNNRKVLGGIVEVSGCQQSAEAEICRSIDKLDKIGFDGVEKELAQRGVPDESISRIMEVIRIDGSNPEVIDQATNYLKDTRTGMEGLEEILTILDYLRSMGITPGEVQVDLSLARGLDYYTGPIFESVVEKPKIGSLTGGGRFDNLIGQYMGQDVPAVGNSVGLERIVEVMDELDMYPDDLGLGIQVMICRFDDEDIHYSIRLVEKLRKNGFCAEIYPGKKGLRGQLGYADDRQIPVVIIAGGREIEQGVLTVKDMKRGKQQTIDQGEIIEKVRSIIKG